MTAGRWTRAAALAAVALAVFVAGFLLRPLLVPENKSAPPVLSPTEIGFIQDMSLHHQQALFMAQRLDPGADAGIRRLATQIADTQLSEIGTLSGWLRLANASPTNPSPMAWMHGSEHAAHDDSALMPGMATMTELDALSAARGAAAETLFLQLMLRHHAGGVTMAKAADELIAAGPVKETARSMITGQSQEAGLMTLLRAERGAQPLS
ncbi:DUF305 domain-containing protein [Nocardia crassostreae]|uniref:DUF305 domain-containing protein n=1 Tax=Nocardia crassostreae TaxID=53428 RepID=UPI00082F5AC7|nr:DUF305 domain-containing protein [Nocardia crassostreae]